MKYTLLLIIGFVCIMQVTAQKSVPITHEAMWQMHRVGSPALSPDGKWVVYSVTEPSYDEKEVQSDLWIAATDGSQPPRRITQSKGGESGYKWSPDGHFIAFSAKRDGDEASQLYLMDMHLGGEARRLTHLSSGASAPKWSPDGSMLLFTSTVWPGAFTDSLSKKKEEEKKQQKYKARIYTSFPIREWDHWLDEKQTHLYVLRIDDASPAVNIMAGTGLTNGEGYRLGGATFSPDGKNVIASVRTNANTGAWQDAWSNLFEINLATGKARQLTSDGNDYAEPAFSPDGNYLLCKASAVNNYKVYNLDNLVRFDWPSMTGKTEIMPGMDRPINNFELSGDKLFFSQEDQGRDKLMQTGLNGGKPAPIAPNTKGCYTNIQVTTVNGREVIVANFESAVSPAEVVLINSSGTGHTILSNVNTARLAALDLPYPEEFWTTTSRGKKIRSMIVKPAGFDPSKKYPLFVVMHGGPAGSWKENWSYRWNYHLLAAPGYVLVVTDYTGSTGYGEKFSQDIQFDPFIGPADEINEAAADAIKRYSFIDGNRQACGGASYGGHLASWMQATTTHYKCLINHAGLVNSEAQWGTSDYMWGREVMNGGPHWDPAAKTWKEQNPIKLAANFKTPVLLTVGEQDFRVPLNNTLENWGVQQRHKIPSKLIVFPDENHWILKAENSRFFYKELHQWLADHLN